MDTGFHHEQTLSSALNRHAIAFQSSAIGSTSEMIMMGGCYRMDSTAGMMFSGNSGMVNSSSGYARVGNSCGSVLSDSVPGLKHDAGLAVEWSVEEQYKLEEGLSNIWESSGNGPRSRGANLNMISNHLPLPELEPNISRYAGEPSIMRYIKIAATLRDKTVRDVALRCRWMARKRRKQDELKLGKKLKDKKDKLVGLSSQPSISSLSTLNVAPFSVTMNNQIQSGGIPFEALSGSIRHRLEQNNQVLVQISANISALKLQDNVGLFSQTKNNITAILNDMRYMPGPPLPLPVSLNEDLANNILPTTSQMLIFGSSSRMHLKQEPDY